MRPKKETVDFDIKFNVEERIKALEHRVKLIELRRGRKQQSIAKWIQSNFDRKLMKISTKQLMRLSKFDGYSWQMVQRARREELNDKIFVVNIRGKGWHWTNNPKYDQ